MNFYISLRKPIEQKDPFKVEELKITGRDVWIRAIDLTVSNKRDLKT